MRIFINLLWKQKQKVGQCFCLFRLLIAKDGPVLFVVKKVENELEEESKVSGPGVGRCVSTSLFPTSIDKY